MRSFSTVVFKKYNHEFSIKLYNKYTCIVGNESGEGKSKLLVDIELGTGNGSVQLTCTNGLHVYVYNNTLSHLLNGGTDRSVFIVDEAASLSAELWNLIDASDHIFIFICRAMPVKREYGYHATYHLQMTDNWYTVSEGLLRLYNNSDIDCIVTEAREDRSEHELVSMYFDNVKAACGRDRVEKALRRNTCSTLVLMDLGNIGNAYRLLAKRCSQNPNLYFYDYQAFEELLYESQLVKSLGAHCDLDVTRYASTETYFEDVLTEVTKSTELEYKHGKPLVKPYLDKRNFKQIFDSEIGHNLMQLLERSITKSTFDTKEYFINVLGKKAEFLPIAAVAECKTKDDCDALIDSLKNVL